MSGTKTYDFNFFKPKSAFAKENTLLISGIVVFWALGVFGFHFLLKAVEKPVPEKQFTTFEQIWPHVADHTATPEQLRSLSHIYLNLLGRFITLRSDQDFKLCFTSTVYQVLPENQRGMLQAMTGKGIPNPASSVPMIAESIGLEKDDILAQVLPYGLVPYDGKPVDPQIMAAVPGIMKKHLIHYQSALTDTRVLGFPFHYFYTAVFLLTLFVVLCLVYCKIFDKIVSKHGMENEEVTS